MTSVPINFVLPEFDTTIRLDTDISTEVETQPIPIASFKCDVSLDVNLLRDTFLFSTNDVNDWSSSINLEKTTFFVNRSLTSSSVPFWKQYSNIPNMFNIASSNVTNGYLVISDYTTKTLNIDVTEIFCAWYMSKILNGIKDAQVLVNNASQIKSSIHTLFKDEVFNTSIDSTLWHYNMWDAPTIQGASGAVSYSELYPSANVNSIKKWNLYQLKVQPDDNNLVYGIPFVTNNTASNQTLPQRLFEQIGYNDLQRINTLSANHHITPEDVYDSVSNTTSRIPPEILGPQRATTPLENVYRFPFIVNDILIFKLNIKVKIDNTLKIFNNANGVNNFDSQSNPIPAGNITSTVTTLKSDFNLANTEHVNYLSFLVQVKLV
jgi:hypothetical protein